MNLLRSCTNRPRPGFVLGACSSRKVLFTQRGYVVVRFLWYSNAMASNPQKMPEQIEAIEPGDPREFEEFQRLIERLHRQNSAFSPRTIAREVNRAVREVRAKRISSKTQNNP